MSTTPAERNQAAITFTIPGEPQSKARPRYSTRNGKVVVYTPKSTVTAEQRIASEFRSIVGAGYEVPDDDAFRVECTFFSGTLHRRDVDNMLKAVLDGLNQVAWRDDALVTEIAGRKVLADKETARTEVSITNLGPRERLRKPCKVCGKRFVVYKSTVDKAMYCSPECLHSTQQSKTARICPVCGKSFTWQDKRRQTHCSRECDSQAGRKLVPCSHCGKTFSKQRCHVRAANYCTSECQADAQAARQRKSPPKGTCQVCGGPVSRPEYKRCNPCKLRNAQPSGKPTTIHSEEPS